jgi:hypothetical protein
MYEPDGLVLVAHTLGFIICIHVCKKVILLGASASKGETKDFS